jgi:hypothetical protein
MYIILRSTNDALLFAVSTFNFGMVGARDKDLSFLSLGIG